MPFYQIYHSYKLDKEQRQAIATSITNLHRAAFTTPSFFVHVRFVQEDASAGDYFLAGKPHTATTNRIIGTVRMSTARSKTDVDELAAQIEGAWYEALNTAAPADKNEWTQEDEKKRLIKVTFVPMIAVREGGMAIPQAGQEGGGWLKEQMPFFEEMSGKGITDFTELLEELKGQDDLKKLLQ